jgi:hypothetical protein
MIMGLICSKTIRLVLLSCAFGLSALSAAAQTQYDANCNPKDYTADELLQQELCSAHVGCRLTMKLGNSACKVKDFFSNLGGVLGGRSTPDNLDVVEALNRTEVPQTLGVKKTNASARPYYEGSRLPSYDRTNAAQISIDPMADGRSSGYLNRDKGGTTSWFEGTGALDASGKRSGNGVQIDSTGRIRAGILINDAVDGGGLDRSRDGSWSAGTFKSGSLEGSGYQLKSDGKGDAPVLEGTFKNNQPDGVMLATWPDLSSRKELWKDGKLIAAGAKVAKGQIPPEPKTPEQEAAAEKAKFEADLAKLPNAGAIYAFADEWASKGDMERARAAWRSLMTRYPDSALALKAADRLSAGSGGSPGPVADNTGSVSSDLTGEWRGETTGNTVYINQEANAIFVSAVTLNPGQDPNAMRFQSDGVGKYFLRFPDGNTASVTTLSSDRLEVVQPGWRETFRRTSAPEETVSSQQACTGSPQDAFRAFDSEFASFNARYPVQSWWSMRDTYKYSLFLGTEGLKILEKYRGCMSQSDFTSNWNALNGAKESGINGCRSTSSDGGAGCVSEYPG